jgi:hypothetical protein
VNSMSKLDDLKRWRDELAECTYEVVQNERQMLDWAIQQIERPADAEIDKAIETLVALCSGQIEHKQHDSETKCPICAAHDLAIQALRQMKQEPCQWCADAAQYMTWIVYEKNGQRYTGKPEFCPCCGRPLPAPPEKGDDK